AFVFGPKGGVSGIISGGAGNDLLDYRSFGAPFSVNLVAGTATNTGGISSIEAVLPMIRPFVLSVASVPLSQVSPVAAQPADSQPDALKPRTWTSAVDRLLLKLWHRRREMGRGR